MAHMWARGYDVIVTVFKATINILKMVFGNYMASTNILYNFHFFGLVRVV